MGKYFGTDGFRGEAGTTLTAEQVYKVGRFLGWYFKQNKTEHPRILIGKDTRRSCYMFEYMLSGGIAASGGDVYLMHVTTTPSVAYITRSDSFDCGIMITASHNPYYDNGIKIINSEGEKMEDSVLNLCEQYIDGLTAEIPYAKRDEIGLMVDYASGRNRYIGYLISHATNSFRGKRIGLDCANGTTWSIARSVFEALGAEVCVINAEPNGLNVNLNAGSTHIEGLQALVREKKLDCGFAFDGDADRCLAVDENGEVISGDHILYIFGTFLKSRDKLTNNTIVTTVMSNLGLYKALDAAGIGYAKTDVGDKYVHDYMLEHDCTVGGEQSGHIILAKFATTGDGLLTAIKLCDIMMQTKKSLAELTKDLLIYPQVLINVRVADKKATMASPKLKEKIAEAEGKLNGDGRILVRASGTEPVVRVMVEARTQQICREIAEELRDYMLLLQ